MPSYIEMKGRRFGRLTVLSRATPHGIHPTKWYCVCDCGKKKVVAGANMRRRHKPSKSCGCLTEEAKTTHGMTYSDEFRIWQGMVNRVTRVEDEKHKRLYIDRGITVCKKWRSSFSAFFGDMGPRPSKRHSIDRKNNNKGYYKKNCRWALPQQQGRNRTNNRFIVAFGERKTMVEWCEEYGILKSTLRLRLRKGWDPEQALTDPGLRRVFGAQARTVGSTSGGLHGGV